MEEGFSYNACSSVPVLLGIMSEISP